MKKKIIISILIILTLTVTLGLTVYFHGQNDSQNKNNSQNQNDSQTCMHKDIDIDMKCDKCQTALPFENYFESKNVEAVSRDNTLVNISGNMPKDANANITAIDKQNIITVAQKYASIVNIEEKDIVAAYDISLNSNLKDIIAAYDISLNSNLKDYQSIELKEYQPKKYQPKKYQPEKYQPKKYNQTVKVELSNLNLESNKKYAMLHLIDDSHYEILPIEKLSNQKIAFNATSFSTYILITVEGHTVTFTGENYKVYNISGDEITNGTIIDSGTDFRFIVDPNDDYGVTDITCLNSSSESVIETTGYLRLKSGKIASVTEDLTIDVTTAIVPEITVQPVSVKTKVGNTVTFSLEAQNATTYQWQYRDSKEAGWTNVSSSLSSTSSLSVTTNYTLFCREYRCLVGNETFTNHERVVSDVVKIFMAEDEITADVALISEQYILQPKIITQPVSIKGKLGTTVTFTLEAENATTYQWQYRDDRETYWTSLSSSSTPDLKITAASNISGREYRCLVGNEGFVLHSRSKSDIVVLSVTEDEIYREVNYVGLNIKKQPESQKVKLGDVATFEIEAEYVDTYKWQYKVSGDSEEWLDVDATLGTSNATVSGYDTNTLTIDTSGLTLDEETLTLSENLSGYVFRCVVTSPVLKAAYRESDGAVLSLTQDEIVTNVEFIDEGKMLITEWKIGPQTTIQLPIPTSAGNNYTVDWGDGSSRETFDSSTNYPTHTYTNTEEAVYTIEISGQVDVFGYSNKDIPTITNTYKDYYDFTNYLVGIVQWGKIGVTQIGFANCFNLTGTIPTPEIEAFENVVSMENLFYGCSLLGGAIPEALFAGATEVTNFAGAFSGCEALSGNIPDGLFETNTKVTSFAETFLDCLVLQGSIPATLFTNNTEVTDFSRIFENCGNLSGLIPAALFSTNKKVTTFVSAFKDCINLSGTIPADLFIQNTLAEDFSNTFNGCSKLSGMIPARLFSFNSKVTNFESTFEGCSSITAGELQINTDVVTNMNTMFKNCTKLESVVFGMDVNTLTGTNMFENCSTLTAVILLKQALAEDELKAASDLTTLGMPSGATIYVAYKENEAIYEKVWSNIDAARIERIVKAVEPNPDYVKLNEEYIDPGYTIAGFTLDEKDKYTQYGFYVEIIGTPVDTSEIGSEWIKYILYKN